PRDHAARDLVDELVARAALRRLDPDPAIAELALAAGLLLVPSLALGLTEQRLAIRHARRTQRRLRAVLPLQPRERDLEMPLPHPLDDHLVRLGLEGHLDRRILVVQAMQAGLELLLVGPRRGLDRERDER